MLAGDIVETAADADGLDEAAAARARPGARRSSTSTGSARGRCERGGSARAVARTSRFSSSATTGSFVLRRPPRPPLPPSAHDVVREARLQLALREAGFTRLPTIAAVCEDESLLGVPFYVMTYLDGFVPADELPPGLETETARRRARRRSRRRARRDPRGRCHDAGPRRVRASGELQRAAGTALRAALGDQQDA